MREHRPCPICRLCAYLPTVCGPGDPAMDAVRKIALMWREHYAIAEVMGWNDLPEDLPSHTRLNVVTQLFER